MTQHNRESQTIPKKYHPIFIGLTFQDRADMRSLIDKRVDLMVQQGLIEEMDTLLQRGVPRTCTAFQAIGYKELLAVYDGASSMEDAIEEIKLRSRQYAKRQLTWLRRNEAIHWICWEKERDFSLAVRLSTNFLALEGLQ